MRLFALVELAEGRPWASSDPGPSEAARCTNPPRLDAFPRVSHREEPARIETLGPDAGVERLDEDARKILLQTDQFHGSGPRQNGRAPYFRAGLPRGYRGEDGFRVKRG